MKRELELPDVGEGIAEGEIVSWLVEPGEDITEDQPIAEVETDKAIVEIPSPITGTVVELLAEESDVVPVGEVFVVFEVPGEEADEDQDDATDTEPNTTPESTATDEAEAERSAAAAETDKTESADAVPVFAPPRVRRLAREHNIDLASLADGTGRVTERDVHRATSAADPEANEPVDGGQSAAVTGEEMMGAGPTSSDAALEQSATGGSSDSLQTDQGASLQSSSATTGSTQPAGRDGTLAAPATRQLATELGIDIDNVPASEKRDGEPFVTPTDVREFEAGSTEDQPASGPAGPTGADSSAGSEERIPYRGVRRTIGEQMVTAKYTAPHVTHHDSVDVSELATARKTVNSALEDDTTITYLPFVVKAVVEALAEFPYVNATLDEEAEEIALKYYYNIGIATATESGLMVPVLEDADQKGITDIATEVDRLVTRARSRKISSDEMQGGTFTITNFGAIGGDHATPIINYPEAAILGLGTIEERPVVVNGEVVARPTLPLSLTVDHRLIDGEIAARFTNRVKEYLNEPTKLLL